MYPAQQNATDHTANFFWLLILICISVLGVWWLRPGWIVMPVFHFRVLELDTLVFIGNSWNHIATYCGLPLLQTSRLIQLKHILATMNPKEVTFLEFYSINLIIGDFIRWLVFGILLILGIFSYFKHTTVLFRKIHDIDSLKKLEKENWPQIDPVLSLDLVKTNPEKGPWAMSKTPLDFCKEHNILKLAQKDGKNIWMVKRGRASHFFAIQLGTLWENLFSLPMHVKALIVVFVARTERERDVAKYFLTQIATSATSGKLDFTGVNKQLVKYSQSKILSWLRPRHAYVRTMMASLLESARLDGVLATAEFLWLKPVDRKLWYTLNSVGRQTCVIEVSGIFAHWKAEKAMLRAMKTPMVKEAVNALELCITDILYVKDSSKWRSSGA